MTSFTHPTMFMNPPGALPLTRHPRRGRSKKRFDVNTADLVLALFGMALFHAMVKTAEAYAREAGEVPALPDPDVIEGTCRVVE